MKTDIRDVGLPRRSSETILNLEGVNHSIIQK